MAPLADAMRLIHRDQTDARAAQHVHRATRRQPFRRHIKQLQRAGFQRLPNSIRLFGGITRCQRTGIDTRFTQPAHLVAHQRNQRRDDDRNTVSSQRRQLKTQ